MVEAHPDDEQVESVNFLPMVPVTGPLVVIHRAPEPQLLA